MWRLKLPDKVTLSLGIPPSVPILVRLLMRPLICLLYHPLYKSASEGYRLCIPENMPNILSRSATFSTTNDAQQRKCLIIAKIGLDACELSENGPTSAYHRLLKYSVRHLWLTEGTVVSRLSKSGPQLAVRTVTL